MPLEPLSTIGSYDTGKDCWVLSVDCQGVFGLRGGLAKDVLKVTSDRLQVLADMPAAKTSPSQNTRRYSGGDFD